MLRQQGQAERIDNGDRWGAWRWTGREEWEQEYRTNALEDNLELWAKLQAWPNPTITGGQLATLLGRTGGATSSILRGLRKRGVLRSLGDSWEIVRETLKEFAPCPPASSDQLLEHPLRAVETQFATPVKPPSSADPTPTQQDDIDEILRAAGIDLGNLSPVERDVSVLSEDLGRDRQAEGRRQIARGERPPLKEAIKRVMGSKRMSLAKLMLGLDLNKWSPLSATPQKAREYVAQLISHNPDDFEVVERGVYRVKR